jgi:hypothetical protein
VKKLILILLACTFLFINCTSTTYLNNKKIVEILPKAAVIWSLDDCNKILDFYTADNSTNQIFQSSPINKKVYIKALLLNKASVKALARKEVIEKRLDDKEFYSVLETYLKEFTSLTYNDSSKKIIEADSSFAKGYSFNIHFENISNPYEPIFLEDGYSYFFLENMTGEFSRVTEVSGLFVEDYFQLDDYLDAIITFSPFSTIGKRLFDEKDLNESYKLVFNGLRNDSISVQWILK